MKNYICLIIALALAAADHYESDDYGGSYGSKSYTKYAKTVVESKPEVESVHREHEPEVESFHTSTEYLEPSYPLGTHVPLPQVDIYDCGYHQGKTTCPQHCTLEWRPVLAKCDHDRIVRFVNCCSLRRDVCVFKRQCTFLRYDRYSACKPE